MSGNYILDDNGRPVLELDVVKWDEWYAISMPQRQVAKTDVSNKYVSTVFLGMDHNWGGAGPPILYETMVFSGELEDDLDMDRYETREQAVHGHEAMVDKVKAGE